MISANEFRISITALGRRSVACPRFIQCSTFAPALIKVEIHPSREAAGTAAANAAAEQLTELAKTPRFDRSDLRHRSFSVRHAVCAHGLSPICHGARYEAFIWMNTLVSLLNHPASFRHYLRERLTQKVRMKEFLEIFGDGPDPEETARAYAETLRAADPQLCLLGIGENGHLAFNDPDVADFTDPLDAKIVQLDRMCREQQVAEKWFANIDEVPQSAITLTVPALMRIPRLIVSVPGPRKAQIVRRALEESISSRMSRQPFCERTRM